MSLPRRHPAVRENRRSGQPLIGLGEDRLGRRQTHVASARVRAPPEPFPKLSCRRGARVRLPDSCTGDDGRSVGLIEDHAVSDVRWSLSIETAERPVPDVAGEPLGASRSFRRQTLVA